MNIVVVCVFKIAQQLGTYMRRFTRRLLYTGLTLNTFRRVRNIHGSFCSLTPTNMGEGG